MVDVNQERQIYVRQDLIRLAYDIEADRIEKGHRRNHASWAAYVEKAKLTNDKIIPTYPPVPEIDVDNVVKNAKILEDYVYSGINTTEP